MIDRCGRNIDYLRISVTDRCNLRCIYCMPEEGVQHVERSLILQEEEILRICRVMAELGIRKIKLTGGEPLVRPRMPKLVEKLKKMPGIEKVTLTTNGVLLKDQMRDFARAGLDGLNISLDTLDEACSRRITRRDELGRTLEGISEAMKYPEISLKINCVPLGIPEQDLCRVALLLPHHRGLTRPSRSPLLSFPGGAGGARAPYGQKSKSSLAPLQKYLLRIKQKLLVIREGPRFVWRYGFERIGGVP